MTSTAQTAAGTVAVARSPDQTAASVADDDAKETAPRRATSAVSSAWLEAGAASRTTGFISAGVDRRCSLVARDTLNPHEICPKRVRTLLISGGAADLGHGGADHRRSDERERKEAARRAGATTAWCCPYRRPEGTSDSPERGNPYDGVSLVFMQVDAVVVSYNSPRAPPRVRPASRRDGRRARPVVDNSSTDDSGRRSRIWR